MQATKRIPYPNPLTKKDAENDPLNTRTQPMHKTSRGRLPVPSPVSLPFNPRDSTKGPLHLLICPSSMPQPETFLYRQTHHHPTIPNYVARKPVKTTNVLFYWLTRAPPSLPPSLPAHFRLTGYNLDATDVEIGFWPDFGRRIPPPPSMPPHLPTLAHPPTC